MSYAPKTTNTYMDYHPALRRHLLEYYYADHLVSKVSVPKLIHLLRMNHEDIIQA